MQNVTVYRNKKAAFRPWFQVKGPATTIELGAPGKEIAGAGLLMNRYRGIMRGAGLVCRCL